MTTNRQRKRTAEIAEKRQRQTAQQTPSPPKDRQPTAKKLPSGSDTASDQSGTRKRTTPAGPRRSEPQPSEQSDPLSDPEALFKKLSIQLAPKVEKSAVKAGNTAAKKISDSLTEELNEAISQAMSAAGKVGALVRENVHGAVDDALRTAVLQASQVREQQLAQLAVIDRTARQARNLDTVRLRIDAELTRAGLQRVTNCADLSLFDREDGTDQRGSAAITAYEVSQPAYVDKVNGRVVQRGRVRPSTTAVADEERP